MSKRMIELIPGVPKWSYNNETKQTTLHSLTIGVSPALLISMKGNTYRIHDVVIPTTTDLRCTLEIEVLDD
jgi:hypothetical protein